jgi:hypothetical protein
MNQTQIQKERYGTARWWLLCLLFSITIVAAFFCNGTNATHQNELICVSADDVIELDLDVALVSNEVDCKLNWPTWYVLCDPENRPCVKIRYASQSLRGPPSPA